jgi:signal transduction histidine kinase
VPTPTWTPPLGRVLLAALYALTAAGAVHVVTSAPAYALAGASTSALIAEIGAGALLLAAGLALLRVRPAQGLLLAAAAIAWPLIEWNSPAAAEGTFTAGLIAAGLWAPLLAAAVLWQGGLTWPASALVTAAVLIEVGLLGVASATVFDPAAQGCATCPANRLLVSTDLGAWHEVGRIGLLLSAAWAAAFVLLAAIRMAHSPHSGPLLVPAAVALGLLGVGALHGADRGFRSNDVTDRALFSGQLAAFALVAAAVATGRLRARRRRAAVQRLALDVSAAGTGSLQDRLAAVLGDPSLVLVHARADDRGWMDARGRDVAPAVGAGRQTAYLTVAGRRVAALMHRPGLLDDPAVIAEIETTAAMALRLERLQAVRLVQLAQLRAAWGRIVEGADAERRRLERDLHDGAQQRLVTAAVGVELARRHHAGDADLGVELAAVAAQLDDTVDQVRRIGHGVFPATLDAEGLAAAVDLLTEEHPRLLARTVADGRLPPAVESATYYLIEQALRIAPAGDVELDIDRDDGHLLVALRAESGFGPLPVRVTDRVGAVGGTVATDVHRLQARMPCAW